MKRTKWIAFVLVLVMTLGLMPISVSALDLKLPETFETTNLGTHVNPLYENVLSPEDFDFPTHPAEPSGNTAPMATQYVTIQKAGQQMRDYMEARKESFSLYIQSTSSDYNQILEDVFAIALEHTGQPKEGDSLLWQYAAWSGSVDGTSDGENYQYCYTLDFAYYTTAAQEKELDSAVSSLLKSLNVSGKSDYQKICAVYDYMCENITYDYDNLEDESYTLKFTPYAALKNKTAVCQGYALLFYRLMLELGIDCRVIAGDGGGPHGWNIVKLGDVYYNADTTWDAGYDEYAYFLKNTDNFVGHARYLDYMTTQFHTDYPVSATDYVNGVAGEPEYFFVIGQCGENAYFGINRDRQLVIAGEGATYDFAQTNNIEQDGPIWNYWVDGFDHLVVDEGITVLGQNVFYNLDNITNVTLPSTLITISTSVFSECDGITNIILPENLEGIGAYAFSQCRNLVEIEIPDNVRTLGGYAFYYCYDLTSVKLSDSLTEICISTFESCSSLTKIVIPDQVTVIGDNAFENCYNLSKITFGKSVTTIGSYAFRECRGIKDVVIPDHVITVEDHAFYACEGLESIKFGKSTVEIPKGVVESCRNLKYVEIPDNVEFIGDYAFKGCHALEECYIPASITKTGIYVFADCVSLKKAVIDADIEIEMEMFYGCKALETVELNGEITVLKSAAFSDCTSLKEITIPATVQKIYGSCFDGCEALQKIIFTGPAPSIDSYAFEYVTATAYYPGDLEGWEEVINGEYRNANITWVSTHTHKYTSSVVAPTCTEQGYTIYTCSGCGNVYQDNYVDALGHDYVSPTYLSREEGHRYTCSRCGDVKIEACSFDEGTIVTEATLHSSGVKKYSCTVCGGSYQTSYQYRIAGTSRIDTAIAVADQLKAVLGIEKFDAIIIANGDNFADALAGSYLAAQKNAPILQHRNSGLGDDKNEAYIQSNLTAGGTVYLLGGELAVPTSIEERLTALGYKVVRLAGTSRFDTNLAILEEAGVAAGDEILVATGWDFADCLSASATGKPILMLNTKLGVLTDAQKEFLNKHKDSSFTIVGGTVAVSADMETAMEAIVGDVDRVYGTSREDTSIAIAERYFDDPDCVLLAFSRNFPDGLCGGPLANAMNAPLLLVNANREAPAAEYVAENGITKGIVLGGTLAISDETVQVIFGE